MFDKKPKKVYKNLNDSLLEPEIINDLFEFDPTKDPSSHFYGFEFDEENNEENSKIRQRSSLIDALPIEVRNMSQAEILMKTQNILKNKKQIMTKFNQKTSINSRIAQQITLRTTEQATNELEERSPSRETHQISNG